MKELLNYKWGILLFGGCFPYNIHLRVKRIPFASSSTYIINQDGAADFHLYPWSLKAISVLLAAFFVFIVYGFTAFSPTAMAGTEYPHEPIINYSEGQAYDSNGATAGWDSQDGLASLPSIMERNGLLMAYSNPSASEIKNKLYNAAVARNIPPEILYGIAYQESGWRQFDGNGNPLISFDGGIGIMQVTSYGSFDVNRLKTDIDYNIGAGASILVGKWNATPIIGDNSMACYENWFYSVWAYNGWVSNNQYPYTVWAHIAAGRNGWWVGIPVTPVPKSWLVNGFGVKIPTPQPAHFWNKTSPPPVDKTAPTGTLSEPDPSEILYAGKSAVIIGSFKDNTGGVGVAKVSFYADYDGKAHLIGTDSHGGEGTYSDYWSVPDIVGKTVTIRAHAYDKNNNHKDVATVKVKIQEYPHVTVTGGLEVTPPSGEPGTKYTADYTITNRGKYPVSITQTNARILSAGSSFTRQMWYDSGWSGWDWNRTKLVTGDFDGDGKDDLVAFYNYPNKQTKAWFFKSYGSSFNRTMWWDSGVGGWDWEKTKLVAGDFNGDGKDDLVAFYNYAGKQTKAWFFKSSGSSFARTMWWDSGAGGWNWDNVKIVSGDFDGDGKDDIVDFHNYGSGTTKAFLYKSSGSSFSRAMWWDSGAGGWDWDRTKLVAGDVNGDGRADPVSFYNYDWKRTKAWTFLSGSLDTFGATGAMVLQPGKSYQYKASKNINALGAYTSWVNVSIAGDFGQVNPRAESGASPFDSFEVKAKVVPPTTPPTTPPDPPSAYNAYFPWYDNVSAQNWILMANPSSAPTNASFSLSVAGAKQTLGSLPGLSSGITPAGGVLFNRFPGLAGGPVSVGSSAKAIISQRVLWGNSLEEVQAVDESRLSDHYWWLWYDQKSPGMKDWVLIANPGTSTVTYTLKIAGAQVATGSLKPGEKVTPTFAGKMGGPVELTASGKVIASQRILSSQDRDFTEVTGIPDSELSDHYLWTWYDNQSPGATDWVMIANPGSSPVTYDIKIAGSTVKSGTIDPGQQATPFFKGKMGGPVELIASGKVIASQRVVWNSSFDELAGYPYSQLKNSYAWTWYDQKSPGSQNWVLIANPGTSAVTYEVKIAGSKVASGTLNPGERATPAFPGTVNGPVEVTASGPVMASQRVLWSGYFVEVVGSG